MRINSAGTYWPSSMTDTAVTTNCVTTATTTYHITTPVTPGLECASPIVLSALPLPRMCQNLPPQAQHTPTLVPTPGLDASLLLYLLCDLE